MADLGNLTSVRFRRDGDVARVTFARPQSLNALSPELIDEALAVALDVAASNARVLIVEGEGRSFSAGGKLHSKSSV